MNKEQLTRANELAERIEKLETQLEGWQYVIGIHNENIRFRIGRGCVVDLVTGNIDVKVMKALAISKIESELEVLRNEFDNL
ncbi:MAG: hypothetical protein EGQ20_07185 [Bacteroides oleiciplenus]|nr:hypothetical protein [Bacteroides oleiciplenus]